MASTPLSTPTQPVPDSRGDGQQVPAQPPTSSTASPAAIAAATLALLVFVGFIVFLLCRLGVPQDEWDRAMVLFGSFEALVFAAAGFLFGREVNRAQAVESKKEAQEQGARAAQNGARALDFQAKGQQVTQQLQQIEAKLRRERKRSSGEREAVLADKSPPSTATTDAEVLRELEELRRTAADYFGVHSGLGPQESGR